MYFPIELSANLTEEHIKLNSEPFKCSLGEKKKGLKINKKGKKSLKQISSSEINKIVDFGGTNKSKRVRTIFTPEQLERLETEFEKQQYMVGIGRLYLASTLNLTEAQVKVWFQVSFHLILIGFFKEYFFYNILFFSL